MINSTLIGNLGQPIISVLAGATATDILTAKGDATTIAGFSFSNPTGGAVSCYLYWTVGGVDRLIWCGSVASKETGPDAQKVYPIKLRDGEKIRALGASSVVVALYPLQTLQVR